MTDQLKKLVQTTLPGMEIYTSLPESAVGLSQSESQESKKDMESGQVVAHANHSLSPTNTKQTKIVGTSGDTFTDLSKRKDLHYALANRLRVRLEGLGSPLYDYKWKVWDMLQSPPIFALRASGRHTSGNVFTGDQFCLDMKGWMTPRARGDALGSRWKVGQVRNLEDQARLASWATPTARDWKDGACNLQNNKVKSLLGRQVLLCYAPTVKGDRLNPEFTRWLMGYPKEWGN